MRAILGRLSLVARFGVLAVSLAAFAHAGRALADPVEPIYSNNFFVRVASPGQQMAFTAGLPFRIFADGSDPLGYQYMSTRNVPAEVRFFVDGQMVGVAPQIADMVDYFEVRLPAGLPAGPHSLTVRSLNYNDVLLDGAVAVSISVAPMPAHANTVTLTQDMMLSGSTELNWTDTTVIGNGHRVLSASGWRGNITISNAFITGLGSFTTSGIDLRTGAGTVTIESSIFEATGATNITVDGSGAVTLRKNEFRSNNLLTYVANNPDVPIVLGLHGNTSGAKVFAGNRVGAGQVNIVGMDNWLIGGDDDDASNVFVGPRAVLWLDGSDGAVIRGNYLHHDYISGWSQGFNLRYWGGSDRGLVEHNVIRDGSWPVQDFGGELRYNLLVKSGHDWFRTLMPGSQIHHNVIIHPNRPDGGFDGGFLFYKNEANIDIYHNTFDGGGDAGQFKAPIITAMESSMINSFRDNVIQNFDVASAYLDGSGTHVTTADYNCFWNPRAPSVPRYAAGIVANAPGAHDVLQDCRLGAGNEIPYSRPEGDIWRGNYKVSQVLAYYRDRFMPQAGSPVIDKADDVGGDIGAIEAASGTARPDDQFGKFGRTRTDTTPPTVTLTAPAGGSTLQGPVTLQADASDNVGVTIVQFLSGDAVLGESGQAPYQLSIDSCVLGNGTRMLAARAWDADSNSAVSAPVSVTVSNPATCVPVSTGGSSGGISGGGGAGGAGKTSGGCSCGIAGGIASLSLAWAIAAFALITMRARGRRPR